MGVQAQPRRSRSRRLGERIASGRRARVGGWESLEGRQFWTGKALPRQLRFVVKHPLPISPSRDWFALEALCKVIADLSLQGRWLEPSSDRRESSSEVQHPFLPTPLSTLLPHSPLIRPFPLGVPRTGHPDPRDDKSADRGDGLRELPSGILSVNSDG